jgi:hypothetical protein
MTDFSYQENPEPFPRKILCARSPHRLPCIPKYVKLIDDLLHHSINAAAFVMDEDLITLADARGSFINDPKLALADLEKQLREFDSVLGEKIFPTPKPLSAVEQCLEELRRRRSSSSPNSSSSSSTDPQSDNDQELFIPLPAPSFQKKDGIQYPGQDQIGGR